MLLNEYLLDGAGRQARAVMCMLQGYNIEESWNKKSYRYDAEIKIARWENCREQGYVVSLRNKDWKQLNIAFFEHRNSDSIHAVKWVQNTLNSPNIDIAEFGDVYETKYDTSYDVRYGEITKMVNWIFDELTGFWNVESEKETEKNK